MEKLVIVKNQVAAFGSHFCLKGVVVLKVICGDITKLGVDAIVNAANGYIGVMGAGVAKAIKDAGGMEIEEEAKLLCLRYKFNPGSAYYTKAGKLNCRYIIHAVTMRYPGEKSSLETVKKCLNSVFLLAKKLNCKTIAIPGLGTKIGRVPIDKVAGVYVKTIPLLEQKFGIEAVVCDIDRRFINHFKPEL